MKIRPRFQWKIPHTQFAVAFCAVLYLVCNALNIDKLSQWFRRGDGYDHVALAAYLLAGFCLFLVLFVLLAHRWTIKPLALVLVVASGTATYFISKYGVAIDSSMVLNTLHTDFTEVGQLLSWQMVPYGLLLIALPVAVVGRIEITFSRGWRYLLESIKLVAISFAIAVVVLYANFDAIHRAGNVSKKYIVYSLVPVNILSASISVVTKVAKPFLAFEREVEISGRVAKPGDLVVVLAIGETARRKNFSLYGYDRKDTNPALEATDGLHLLNGIARRGSTLNALEEILEKDRVKLPRIVSTLGIPTACYVNFTLYKNCQDPGETKVSDCRHGEQCYDEDVLPLLERDLEAYDSGYRFIVLHLGGGSHGPTYSDRHPPEFLILEPTCKDADVANRCTLEELYNSYDNTILYADFVLAEILASLERSGAPYVFMYLSDHGESLLEEGRLFHGMPPGVPLPPEQAEVPLIVKASVPIRIVDRDEYPQNEIFDTVLDLFSIEANVADESRSFIKRLDESRAPTSPHLAPPPAPP